ncbi:3959_t:CDS:2 [Gigaspora margarita]|uniref:3959_t:CDS:1 n=1 Tax=Gigaspora margarita TaxID=4874 RepID=A0ABM8VW85_GIGMA|nr:3959_t:CDS:2 [Gigaspora margarita]
MSAILDNYSAKKKKKISGPTPSLIITASQPTLIDTNIPQKKLDNKWKYTLHFPTWLITDPKFTDQSDLISRSDTPETIPDTDEQKKPLSYSEALTGFKGKGTQRPRPQSDKEAVWYKHTNEPYEHRDNQTWKP